MIRLPGPFKRVLVVLGWMLFPVWLAPVLLSALVFVIVIFTYTGLRALWTYIRTGERWDCDNGWWWEPPKTRNHRSPLGFNNPRHKKELAEVKDVIHEAFSTEADPERRDHALDEATHAAADKLRRYLGRELTLAELYRINDSLTVLLDEWRGR